MILSTTEKCNATDAGQPQAKRRKITTPLIPLQALPTEMLALILDFVDNRHLVRFARTCSTYENHARGLPLQVFRSTKNLQPSVQEHLEKALTLRKSILEAQCSYSFKVPEWENWVNDNVEDEEEEKEKCDFYRVCPDKEVGRIWKSIFLRVVFKFKTMPESINDYIEAHEATFFIGKEKFKYNEHPSDGYTQLLWNTNPIITMYQKQVHVKLDALRLLKVALGMIDVCNTLFCQSLLQSAPFEFSPRILESDHTIHYE